MKLFAITALVAACGAAKLDRTYLPPTSATSAGGSPGDIQLPFERSQTQNNGLGGIPKGSFTNEFQGVVVDAAAPGTRSSGPADTGLGGPRQSYGSQDSKVGDAAFKNSNSNGQPVLHQRFSSGQPNAFHHGQFSGQVRPADGFGTHSAGQFGQQPERPQAAQDRVANTLKFDSEVGPESYSYAFETDNGIAAEENGLAANGVQAKGAYSYTGDDGQVYSITYTADETGYHPQGDHLPTPPPIPEEILKSIEQNARDEAAGLIDDGSYDAGKYNAEGDYSESDGDSGQHNRNHALQSGTGNRQTFAQSSASTGFPNSGQGSRVTSNFASQQNFGQSSDKNKGFVKQPNSQSTQFNSGFESSANQGNFGQNSDTGKGFVNGQNIQGSQATQSGSGSGFFGAKPQQTIAFGNQGLGHTSAKATSFGSSRDNFGNEHIEPRAQTSNINQQTLINRGGFGQRNNGFRKDSDTAGTIQETQRTSAQITGVSSTNQFSSRAEYLPPSNQRQNNNGITQNSFNSQRNTQESFPGNGERQTGSVQSNFEQFNSNQQQVQNLSKLPQQNNIVSSSQQFSQLTPLHQSSSVTKNTPSDSTTAPQNIASTFTSASSHDGSPQPSFQSQRFGSQSAVSQTSGNSDTPQTHSQSSSTSFNTQFNQPTNSKFSQAQSFDGQLNNRVSANTQFENNQRQSQDQNRFTGQQFSPNTASSSFRSSSSNAFQQNLNGGITSDQPYHYDQPSKPFQIPTRQGHSEQFSGPTRFPTSSSDQFNRVTQQFSNKEPTSASPVTPSQRFSSSSSEFQSQFNSQSQQPGASSTPQFQRNQPTKPTTQSNTFSDNQSDNQQVSNFGQRGSSQSFGQGSFPSRSSVSESSTQFNSQNQQVSSVPQKQKETVGNSQVFGTQQSSTQQTFGSVENNSPQSTNFDVKQGGDSEENIEQATKSQSSSLGELYEYNKPPETLPSPNKDQSGSSTQISSQNTRFGASQTFRQQPRQFSSQDVAGKGEVFDVSRKPPSFDSETGYHYR